MKSFDVSYSRRSNIYTLHTGGPLGDITFDRAAVLADTAGCTGRRLIASAALICFTVNTHAAMKARGIPYNAIEATSAIYVGKNRDGQTRLVRDVINTVVDLAPGQEEAFEQVRKVMSKGCHMGAAINDGFPTNMTITPVLSEGLTPQDNRPASAFAKAEPKPAPAPSAGLAAAPVAAPAHLTNSGPRPVVVTTRRVGDIQEVVLGGAVGAITLDFANLPKKDLGIPAQLLGLSSLFCTCGSVGNALTAQGVAFGDVTARGSFTVGPNASGAVRILKGEVSIEVAIEKKDLDGFAKMTKAVAHASHIIESLNEGIAMEYGLAAK